LTREAPSLAPFGALSFFYFASIGLLNPYAPLWFQQLGFSTLAIGGIASLQAWTRVAGPYAWSWAGDHWACGTRRVSLLRIACAASLVLACALLFVRGYGGVSLAMFLLFLANSGVMPLNEAALSQRLTTADGLDVARYGRVRVWGSLGFIASVTACGVLLQASGIEWMPALAVLLCAALAGAAWRLPTAATAVAAPAANAPGGVWAAFKRPAVPWFFASVFLTVLAHTSLYAFLSLYLVELGYGKSAVGALWAVSVAVEIVFFWTQGRWFALWSAPTWLAVAAAVSVLRFGAMALLGGSATVLVITQSLHAITFAAHHAACIALVSRWFPGPLRGRGQALYSTLGYGLSGVIGGVAGGAISQRWGFPAVFGAAALASLAAWGCCVRSARLERKTASTPAI
jgi:MFS transporter, PPP family, 3-phenylpropionic acid transporter